MILSHCIGCGVWYCHIVGRYRMLYIDIVTFYRMWYMIFATLYTMTGEDLIADMNWDLPGGWERKALRRHQGRRIRGVRRGSRPSWQNLGGAKPYICPSIWHILPAGYVTTWSFWMENWLILLVLCDKNATKFAPAALKVCFQRWYTWESIALYLCFTFQLKWTVYLLHGDSFAPSPKNQIRRHWETLPNK